VATTDPTPAHAGRLTSEAVGERLSELFEEHGRMVYGLCRLLLRDANEAEDAAQQVFLSAHRSMLGGTEPREPAAWLGTIARNECHTRIRARMATPLALVVDDRDALVPGVEQVAGERAEIQALCAALAELPQQQREALVLREFYGLSYEEVRAALGLTEGAVDSLLFRARKRLQAELRPARVASGVFALPLALRDSIAGAVPGFAPASASGGALAKLASVPILAKLAGAAATLTVAGSIGYVELGARHHDVVAPPVAVATHSSERKTEKPIQLERVSFVRPAHSKAGGTKSPANDAAEDDELAEGELADGKHEDSNEQGEAENEQGGQDVLDPQEDAGEDDGSVTEPDTDDGGTSGSDGSSDSTGGSDD
jgi:RNA polymerase sigma factor (sigma-70 family)